MTRLLRIRSLCLLAAAPLLIFLLSGFSGYFTAQVFNQPSGDSFFAHVSCSTHPFPGGDTCKGLGQGYVGGALFTGIFKTNILPNALICHQQTCRGGSIRASGNGTWGNKKITFTFCGDDPYPSHWDRVELDFHPSIALDLNGISPFVQIACSGTQGTAPVSHIGSTVITEVFIYTCKDCFRLIRANR